MIKHMITALPMSTLPSTDDKDKSEHAAVRKCAHAGNRKTDTDSDARTVLLNAKQPRQGKWWRVLRAAEFIWRTARHSTICLEPGLKHLAIIHGVRLQRKQLPTPSGRRVVNISTHTRTLTCLDTSTASTTCAYSLVTGRRL